MKRRKEENNNNNNNEDNRVNKKRQTEEHDEAPSAPAVNSMRNTQPGAHPTINITGSTTSLTWSTGYPISILSFLTRPSNINSPRSSNFSVQTNVQTNIHSGSNFSVQTSINNNFGNAQQTVLHSVRATRTAARTSSLTDCTVTADETTEGAPVISGIRATNREGENDQFNIDYFSVVGSLFTANNNNNNENDAGPTVEEIKEENESGHQKKVDSEENQNKLTNADEEDYHEDMYNTYSASS